MKSFKFIVLLALICTTNLVCAQSSEENIEHLIDSQASSLMEKANVPGAAIAIIKDGQVIYQKGIGLAEVNKEIAVTSSTGFNIGSVSKLFTAWGVMRLVEKGKLDLEAPISNYLSRWHLPDSEFDKSKVTIKALLSHSAGISVHGYPGFHPDDELPSLESSLDGENGPIRENEPVKIILEPQTQFKYSGGGYTILQLIIEEVTGRKFENYMQEEVFEPLNMKNTSFTISDLILEKSAKPYDEEGNEIYLERFTAKAAAGLHTTIEDLSVFALAQFSRNPVLTQETIQEMIEIIPVTKTKRGAYGLGYATYSFGPIHVTGHTGSNTGWEAGFMMDFSKKDGFIILTNSSNGKKVAMSLLQSWAKWRMSE